jgi:hypothetical protein
VNLGTAKPLSEKVAAKPKPSSTPRTGDDLAELQRQIEELTEDRDMLVGRLQQSVETIKRLEAEM